MGHDLHDRVAEVSPRRNAEQTGWVLTGGLAVSAWALLAVAGRSPWAPFLEHDGGDPLPAGAAVGVFVTAWIIMLVAMMLPTTAPLVGMFGRLVARRADRRRLVALLLAGFVSVWTAAGLLAYATDAALHGADERWSIIGDRRWALVATVVAAAGLYQLTDLKERCLTRCRTPAGVIVTSWRGLAPAAEAYRIGVGHGWTCVGCCWVLMLIMFAIGATNLGWLLVLAGIMTIEKASPWGAAVTRPVGIALLLLAAALAVIQP